MIYDVVIVGGGPAGSSAAIRLAAEGFHVALLDRARFPRDKACGEFLTPQARALLSDLKAVEAAKQADAYPVTAAVLMAQSGEQMEFRPADGGPAGYALRRADLDALLLRRASEAGAVVLEGHTMRQLRFNEKGAVCGVCAVNAAKEPVELQARLVIGADGSHSPTARQLGLVHARPRLNRLALVSHWYGLSGRTDTIEMRTRGQIVCGLDFPGSSASFALDYEAGRLKQTAVANRKCANLTLVVPTELGPQIAGRAGDFIEQTLQSHFPDLAERLAGAERETTIRAIGCFGHICKPAVADGALLAGDAATFIDPFTGEGVYFALRGAQLAAEVASEALRRDDLSRASLLKYQRARSELARRYLLCDVIQAVVRSPKLFPSLVRRLDRYPTLADRLFSVLADLRPPADVLHPGFLWRLLAPEL